MLYQIKNGGLNFGLMLVILIGFNTSTHVHSRTAADPPKINVVLSTRVMEGSQWTPDGQVQIEVYDSPGGTLIAGPVNVQANTDREFAARDISIYVPGMFIRATDQTTAVVRELTVQNIEITSIDTQNDLVNGIAPPNVFVNSIIEDPPGNWSWGTGSFSDGAGVFSVSFSGIIDIQPYHTPSAIYYDNDGDSVENAPDQNDIFHLQGGYDHDWMEFYYFSPGNTIDFRVLNDQGNLLSSGQTQTNSEGWGYINFDDHGVELQPGYQIMGIDHLTNLSDTITMQDIGTTEVDYDLSYVAGTAPPNTDLKILVGIEGGGVGSIYHFDVHSDAEGNWSSYLVDDFGYELTLETWVYAELSDENHNTTFAALDQDGDEAINGMDNARLIFNPDQSDLDMDGVGDVEDPCPNDFENSCNFNRSGAISVNQLGGVLITPEGNTSIVVPAGSLSKDTSISVTDTGEGYLWVEQAMQGSVFSTSSNIWAVFSNFIGPSSIIVKAPIVVTLIWDDVNNDGVVDDLGIEEGDLRIFYDDTALTEYCENEPACDPANNKFVFSTLTLGNYALVGEKTIYWLYLPVVIR